MIPKYRFVKRHVFEYISNRIQAEIKPAVVAREVAQRFQPELAFYKCEPDMLYEFLCWLAEEAYYHINRHAYEDAEGVSRIEAGGAHNGQ